MRDVVVWLLFVLLGAVVLDLSREGMQTTEITPTEQVIALS